MSKIINLTEGMRFGAGVDIDTEDVRGIALQFDGETTGHGGQQVAATVKMIESQESLMKALDLSVNASVRYGVASGDAKFSLAQDSSVNQYSLYLMLSASVRNPPRYMDNPRLRPDARATYERDPEEFRNTYGDTYIDEIYSGGDFFGLFSFSTFDEQSRTDLKASLDVSVGTFLFSGEISSSFETAIEQAKKKSTMSIVAFMSGGSGLENPSDIEELKRLYRTFNQRVQEKPVDFKASIKEFRYLPLPSGPTYAEQQVRSDTIQQSARRIVEGIKLRGDVEFILKYPRQFEDPDLPALKATYEAIDDQLPKLAARARDCARDITKCTLGGLEPIVVALPKRILRAGDPLQDKWEDINENDSRATAWLPLDGTAPFPKSDRADPKNGKESIGRFKLFYRNNAPIAGLFWHPDFGAHVVYGGIFQAYLAKGHCNGPLGFPKTDEETVTGAGFTGLDRINVFEHGLLWWDAKTGKVSEQLPLNLSRILTTTGRSIELASIVNAGSRPLPVLRKIGEVPLRFGK